jgi:hypothetical protein
MAKSEVLQFWSWFDATGGRVQVLAAQTLCVCGGIGMDMPPTFIEDWEVDSHKSPLPACACAAPGSNWHAKTKPLAAIRIAHLEDMSTSQWVGIF